MPSATTFEQWLAHAGAGDAGAWTPSATLYAAWRAWSARVGERPGSKAAFASRMRAAGVEGHRRNVAKGWRFKITDINEIEENITAATRARKKAHDAHDLNAKASAVREQKIAERRAGMLLEVDPGSPLAHELGEAKCKICVALARLTDAQFAAKVEAVASEAVAVLSAPPSPCPRIRMVASPWILGPDGALGREIYAVEEASPPS